MNSVLRTHNCKPTFARPYAVASDFPNGSTGRIRQLCPFHTTFFSAFRSLLAQFLVGSNPTSASWANCFSTSSFLFLRHQMRTIKVPTS